MIHDPLGIYISTPFCRSKCTYCNFASGVFPAARMGRYIERLCADLSSSRSESARWGASLPTLADTIYMGGGTPSLLPAEGLKELFSALSRTFDCRPLAGQAMEITVECAPGTLNDSVLDAFLECGVNRVSLGVQSFVDREASAVGRLHTRRNTLEDIERLRRAGLGDINIDLIAGLPHQTPESWEESLEQAMAAGAPHISIYMLEVDEDSRLGRELIAGGTRYHASAVPDEEMVAGFYETACARLEAAGIAQYEISNFARPGFESRHNLKYWTRQPYFGIGVDAHSMLPAIRKEHGESECVRLATTDSLDGYLESSKIQVVEVGTQQALEESFFLGLRLNRGLRLDELRRQFGAKLPDAVIGELLAQGLLEQERESLRLTPRGRLLSNEVFERLIGEPAEAALPA